MILTNEVVFPKRFCWVHRHQSGPFKRLITVQLRLESDPQGLVKEEGFVRNCDQDDKVASHLLSM